MRRLIVVLIVILVPHIVVEMGVVRLAEKAEVRG
jgi:hypothetical protein